MPARLAPDPTRWVGMTTEDRREEPLLPSIHRCFRFLPPPLPPPPSPPRLSLSLSPPLLFFLLRVRSIDLDCGAFQAGGSLARWCRPFYLSVSLALSCRLASAPPPPPPPRPHPVLSTCSVRLCICLGPWCFLPVCVCVSPLFLPVCVLGAFL